MPRRARTSEQERGTAALPPWWGMRGDGPGVYGLTGAVLYGPAVEALHGGHITLFDDAPQLCIRPMLFRDRGGEPK